MAFGGSKRAFLMAVLALAGGLVAPVWTAEPPPASEKIQFSSPGDGPKLPALDEGHERVLPFESLQRDDSMSGVLPFGGVAAPAPVPQGATDARTLGVWAQRLDRKKNWVFAKPEEMVDSATAEEVMQVRNYDPSRSDTHRDLMSMFFEEKADRLTASALTPLDRDRSDSPVLPGGRPRSALQFDPTAKLTGSGETRSETVLVGVLPPVLRPTAQGTDASSFLVSTPLATDTARVSSSIRDLLATPEGINPLASSFDPINLWADTTRQEINPVTPQRPGELSTDKRVDLTGLPAPAGTSGYERASALDEMAAKIMGPSSLAPAVTAPVSDTPRGFSSKPGQVQLPTRKF